MQAEGVGWLVGSQVVEVNGLQVTNFGGSMSISHTEQERGFPISFGAIRKETHQTVGQDALPSEAAGAALDSSIDLTDVSGLASQLVPNRAGSREDTEHSFDVHVAPPGPEGGRPITES